jgi:hexokinase
VEKFLELHLDLVQKTMPTPREVPLGWVFSYPAEALADGDARLRGWTKGVHIPGMVGQPVGRILREHLARHGFPLSRVRVLNDTVAALMAGTRDYHRLDALGGLIVATGTNMAVTVRSVPKSPCDRAQVINLESGNFDCFPLTEWDEAVDRFSENPGRQRLEKAVSGKYLPRLCAAAGVAVDPEGSAAQLRNGDPVARAIRDRSADLVAVGLAAAADVTGGALLGVVAEGELFWSAGYKDRVVSTLQRLDMRERVEILSRVADANLVGGAWAAHAP